VSSPPYRNFDEWLSTRPAIVRRLLARWPVGSTVTDGMMRLYVIGAGETNGHGGGGLIVSPVHPAEDYDRAMRLRRFICGECLAQGRIHELKGPAGGLQWLNR